MGSDWPIKSIEEIAAPEPRAFAMGPFGSNIKTDNFVPAGVPVIRGQNLNAERFSDSDFVYLTEEKADELAASNAFPGDLVFTHRGTLGQVGIIPSHAKYARYVVSQSQMKLKCDSSKVDPLFLFYFFRAPQGQYELLSNTSTTGVPAISRPLTTLKSIKVPIPPISDQRAIAHILGSLDDKIELNRKMNETLEAMARAIFKSWFVDFDPVYAKVEGRDPGLPKEIADLFPDSFEDSELGEIPRGWKVIELSKVADVIDCLHSKKPERQETGKILLQVFNVGFDGMIDLSDKYFISDEDYSKWISRMEALPGDLVITKTGRVGAIAQIPQGLRCALGRNIVGIRAKEGILGPRFLRDCMFSDIFKHEIISKTSQGTILQSLHVKHIEKLRIITPPPVLNNSYEEIVGSIHSKRESSSAESNNLASLRDTLLPKFISGELYVPDVEKYIEEVEL